jgi:hypothetical protein
MPQQNQSPRPLYLRLQDDFEARKAAEEEETRKRLELITARKRVGYSWRTAAVLRCIQALKAFHIWRQLSHDEKTSHACHEQVLHRHKRYKLHNSRKLASIVRAETNCGW